MDLFNFNVIFKKHKHCILIDFVLNE